VLRVRRKGRYSCKANRVVMALVEGDDDFQPETAEKKVEETLELSDF
jgi:hypothetical protein